MSAEELEFNSEGVQKHVVGAYVLRGKELLLLRRSKSEDFLPGIVELPSGGVDEGEDFPAALQREVLEETGLVVQSVDTYINSFDYISGSGKKARQYNFVVTISDLGTIALNPAEHDAYYWVVPSAENLAEYKISDATRNTILEAVPVLYAEGKLKQ